MKLILTLTGLFATFSIGIALYISFQKSERPTYNISDEQFTANIFYTDNDVWEYTISGTVPTPCHTVDVLTDYDIDTVSKVNLIIYVNPPSPDQICTQVIENVNISGNLTADRKSNFDLELIYVETMDNGFENLDNRDLGIFESHDMELFSDGYVLLAKYMDNNLWGYLLQGELPTPCHGAEVEILVAESYPEQVSLTLVITNPDEDLMCIQMIQELNLTGEFQSSEIAQLNFNVELN